MDIFDHAMALEKEGEELYREFALETPNKSLKHIFTWLADRELEHYKIFQDLKAHKASLSVENVVMTGIQNIFAEWRERTPAMVTSATRAALYRKALEVERKSVSVYGKYADAADASQKGVFLAILAEEKGHERILESILEFITKPEAWSVNPEFSQLDKDYNL